MSHIYRKVTYKCDEMCTMGGCGKRNVLLLHDHQTCDMYAFVNVKHADDPKPDMSYNMIGSDNMYNALYDLLHKSDDELEGWDAQDFDFYEYVSTPQSLQIWPLKKEEHG